MFSGTLRLIIFDLCNPFVLTAILVFLFCMTIFGKNIQNVKLTVAICKCQIQ